MEFRQNMKKTSNANGVAQSPVGPSHPIPSQFNQCMRKWLTWKIDMVFAPSAPTFQGFPGRFQQPMPAIFEGFCPSWSQYSITHSFVVIGSLENENQQRIFLSFDVLQQWV
ncbi:hypothetical protein ACE6H2_022883 [Prunus campanulata]